MNIDYLFVGISKGNRNDYKELYRLTKNDVYAVAVSHVCDKNLAKEIMAETYKRVWMYAYSYTTDMDGLTWLLEIARNLSVNALLDKDLRAASGKRLLDNLSKVLLDTVLNLSGDRGKMILLSSVTEMKPKELSSFLWYGTGTYKKELRNGFRELEQLDASYKELDIPATIRDNFPECVPDVWPVINSESRTLLAYTSHEVLDLDSNEYAFGEKSLKSGVSDDVSEDADSDKIAAKVEESIKKQRKKRTVLAVCLATVFLLAAAGITAAAIARKKSGKSKNSSSSQINYNEYLGNAQYNTKLCITEKDGRAYFHDPNKENGVYFSSVSGGSVSESLKAGDVSAKEFIVVGDYIYYRSLEDGYIYRASADGTGSVKFSDVPASNISVYGDTIYFSGKNGIYTMPLAGGEYSVLYDCSADENLERYDVEITDDGTIFFSAGAWKGIHYLTDYKGETSIDTVFIDEAYTLQAAGNRLYFTYLGTSKLYIYYFNLDELDSKTPHYIEKAEPGTGAFYAKDGYVYYEGYVSSTDGKGTRNNTGIYRISEEGGEPELLFTYDISGKMFISDLYVSDSMIYCFYSSGVKNASTKLEARSLSNPSAVARTLFGQ